ncbi:MAG: transposase family protein [Acidobacteriota bacterium]
MREKTLLSDPLAIELEYVRAKDGIITLIVKTRASISNCPVCQVASRRIHSRYERQIADLPWQGVAVVMQLQTRRFFCNNPGCRRRIFCERLPYVVAPYARKTIRLNEALELIGFAIGGGSRS